ncbi:MAG: primosomal protein N' [Betaproteobacteria bacterium]|nr:MAG: primosomal protein N' [Betaproteobacteria bacterium]
MIILRVALDVPLPKLFDYRSEDATRADIGYRALVPFGTKRRVGVIVDVAAKSEVTDSRLRPVEKILRDVPPLSREWLALAKFCSDYYHRPLGEVVMSALPPRLRTAKAVPRDAVNYVLTPAGREALALIPERHKRLRTLLGRLARGRASESELEPLAQSARGLLKRAIESGWVAPIDPPQSGIRFIRAHELTSEQQRAVDALRSGAEKFRVSLLFGVTGSGKTEIYLQLIAEVLERRGQVLTLVPEIALTPALESVFRSRFPGACILTQTSAMAELERARGWLQAHRCRADIVLGTRLAVFTRLPRLGLVVVDEEQDASFKQREGVRYSARDLAIARARAAGVPVVLCSATPSLETFHHATSGKYALVQLTRRAIDRAALPAIRLIDTRAHPPSDGVAAPLLEALAARLARGEQSLVFLNRRGYAPLLACPACGWVKGCKRCSAHMVVHLAEQRLRCHHCGLAEGIPRACPECGEPDLQSFGRGTQRLEVALAEKFTLARILRLDSDAVRTRGKLEDLLERAAHADILVGTQLLAKGHHFERLTLAAVLNADSGLFSSDYRASERTFAQLQQVAGRSGRADLPGEVLIQTRYPDHPLYRSLVRHDFTGFARSLLAERREAGFPPYVFEAALRAESRDAARALHFLGSAIERAPRGGASITVFDPAPMSLARLAGMERAQVLLQSRSRPRLRTFLSHWSDTLYRMPAHGVRWHLDVDPIEF